MKILIIYDSFFGNTEKVAQAIGKALDSQEDVEVVRVSNVKPEHLTGLKCACRRLSNQRIQADTGDQELYRKHP